MVKKLNKTEFLNLVSKEVYNAINNGALKLMQDREFWAVNTTLGWFYGLSSKEQAKRLEVL